MTNRRFDWRAALTPWLFVAAFALIFGLFAVLIAVFGRFGTAGFVVALGLALTALISVSRGFYGPGKKTPGIERGET